MRTLLELKRWMGGLIADDRVEVSLDKGVLTVTQGETVIDTFDLKDKVEEKKGDDPKQAPAEKKPAAKEKES